MSLLTDLLSRLATMETKLNTMLDKSSYLQIATVTDNDDPMNLRRVKVTREIQAGQSNSYWAYCGRSLTHIDEPLPEIGSTVLCGLIDGDPHQVVILKTISNDTNPTDEEQTNPINDHTTAVRGTERINVTENQITKIGGNQNEHVDGDIETRSDHKVVISAKTTITIKNDAGASLTLFANGSISFMDNAGRKIYLGGVSDPVAYWDFNNTSIDIINAQNFTINGKSIATVTALDSRGDSLTNRGW